MMDGRVGRLLADPSRWTKGASARNANGNEVADDSDEAHSFCLVGAVEKLYPRGERVVAQDKLRAVISRLKSAGVVSIVEFNDKSETTHADVVALLEKARV